MKKIIFLLVTLILVFSFTISSSTDAQLVNDAIKSLEKGVKIFHSISTNGGYLWVYSTDLKERWGEGYGIHDQASASQIWVQPPGTPSVGSAMLRAYKVTGDKFFLSCAEDAGDALTWGQKDAGGWRYSIDFSRNNKDGYCTFDDNTTQSALRFLIALDQEIQKKSLHDAVEKGLRFMMESQFENGAWPQIFPFAGSYHDFYTYNDNTINDCIKVMLDAHNAYGKIEYLQSIRRAGNFIILSQIAPPQSGWAQQYNHYLQPAWARAFEPPAVCPSVTRRNIFTLIDIYLHTGNSRYLEPIPDALRWLKESQLPNGRWARFCELGTNRPLFYDYGRIWKATYEELSPERRSGYGYLQRNLLDGVVEIYDEVKELGRDKYLEKKNMALSQSEKMEKLKNMEPAVRKVISSQDEMGRWVTKDKYRYYEPGDWRKWDGQYKVGERLRSSVFIRNINTLCDYIELAEQ